MFTLFNPGAPPGDAMEAFLRLVEADEPGAPVYGTVVIRTMSPFGELSPRVSFTISIGEAPKVLEAGDSFAAAYSVEAMTSPSGVTKIKVLTKPQFITSGFTGILGLTCEDGRILNRRF